jgi:hypothetical protein
VLEMRLTILNVLFVAAYLVLWHFALRMRGLYNSYRLSPASREFKDLATAVAIATVPLIPLSLPFGFEYVNSAFLVVFPTLAFAGTCATSSSSATAGPRSKARHGWRSATASATASSTS